MKIFYFENELGEILSENGNRRFIALTGEAAHDYLSLHKGLLFYRTLTEEVGGDEVFVEVPKNHYKAVQQEKNHEAYIRFTIKEYGMEILYFSQPLTSDCDLTLEDVYHDPSASLEDEVLDRMAIDNLRRALQSLSEEDYRIIELLYLSDNPLTERELAKSMGVSQPYINRLKRRILQKLRDFM